MYRYSFKGILSILFQRSCEYIQAKLPDINAAIVTYRNRMLHAWEDYDYNTVIVCWSGINSLLPKEYKVEINSERFNKLVSENKIIVCSKCEEKIPYDTIKVQTLLLNLTTSLITHKQYEKVWACPKCSYQNIFNQKQIKIVKYQEPYYLEVIPEPPMRQFGISDRASYNTKFRKWFILALDEIESKIGRYRADYIAQMDSEDSKMIIDEDHET